MLLHDTIGKVIELQALAWNHFPGSGRLFRNFDGLVHVQQAFQAFVSVSFRPAELHGDEDQAVSASFWVLQIKVSRFREKVLS